MTLHRRRVCSGIIQSKHLMEPCNHLDCYMYAIARNAGTRALKDWWIQAHPPRSIPPTFTMGPTTPAHTPELGMQISSCTVHESGALLLEAGDGDTLDFLLRRRAVPRTSPSGAFRAPPAPAPGGGAGAPCQPVSPVPDGVPMAGGDATSCAQGHAPGCTQVSDASPFVGPAGKMGSFVWLPWDSLDRTRGGRLG